MRGVGIALETESGGVAAKQHVHHETEEWQITSDVPVSALTTAEVLSRALPGRLGCYVLPSDSVLVFKDEDPPQRCNTALARWKALLKGEMALSSTLVGSRIGHVRSGSSAHEEEGDDEEEDEEGGGGDVEEEDLLLEPSFVVDDVYEVDDEGGLEEEDVDEDADDDCGESESEGEGEGWQSD